MAKGFYAFGKAIWVLLVSISKKWFGIVRILCMDLLKRNGCIDIVPFGAWGGGILLFFGESLKLDKSNAVWGFEDGIGEGAWGFFEPLISNELWVGFWRVLEGEPLLDGRKLSITLGLMVFFNS